MMTVSDIIGRWGSAEKFSADIGLRFPSHGRVMKLRGRIPEKHWPNVVIAAQRRGHFDITLDALATANGIEGPAPSRVRIPAPAPGAPARMRRGGAA